MPGNCGSGPGLVGGQGVPILPRSLGDLGRLLKSLSVVNCEMGGWKYESSHREKGGHMAHERMAEKALSGDALTNTKAYSITARS